MVQHYDVRDNDCYVCLPIEQPSWGLVLAGNFRMDGDAADELMHICQTNQLTSLLVGWHTPRTSRRVTCTILDYAFSPASGWGTFYWLQTAASNEMG